MRKKISNIISIILLISVSLLHFAEPLIAQELKKSVLWKISGNELKKPSYLFGTVHIMDSTYFDLHKTVIEKIASSEKMVFEVNTSEPGYQQKALKLSFMESDSLENILSPAEYQEVGQFFRDEFNLPLAAVHKMKPFYLASLIGVLSMPEKTVSYESELMKIAQEEEKEITGISNLEKESAILDKLSLEVQIYTLFKGIEEYKNGFLKREKIFQLYQKRDIQAIYSIMMEDSNADDSLIYEIMFPKRHDVWIPNMIEIMNVSPCFFAVGVGHLPGKKGLIQLLRKKGYKVRPVNMDFQFYH